MLGYSELGRQENPSSFDPNCFVVFSLQERLFRLFYQKQLLEVKSVKNKYQYISQYKYMLGERAKLKENCELQ